MVPRQEHPVTVPLLERETELAAAAHAVEALCADTPGGGVLVYSGEAGLGKTAMLSEVRRMAAGRCTVWSARGGETVTSVPFHVVRQLLQPALTLPGTVDTRGLLGDGYEIIGPALGVAPPDGQADPQGVRDGLDTLVVRLAAAYRPLVLIVDDAHWCDLETLGWLASFVQRSELPVLVVMAYRTEEPVGDTAEFIRVIEAAARECVSMRALTPAAAAGLVRAELGEHADDPFCREVWAVTGGNLYETVELIAKCATRAWTPSSAPRALCAPSARRRAAPG